MIRGIKSGAVGQVSNLSTGFAQRFHWGDCCREDWIRNAMALINGSRLFSVSQGAAPVCRPVRGGRPGRRVPGGGQGIHPSTVSLGSSSILPVVGQK